MDNVVAFANTAGDTNLGTNLGIGEERGTAPPITTRNGDPGIVAFTTQQEPKAIDDGVSFTVTADSPSGGGQRQCVAYQVVYDGAQVTSKEHGSNPQPGDPSHPIARANAGDVLLAFTSKDYGADAGETSPTLRALEHDSSHANGGGQVAIASPFRVRRLMPVECERLQSFPDNYTLVPVRTTKKGKVIMAADGPRYRALGNAMNCDVIRAIGERIRLVNELMVETESDTA